MKTYVLTVSRNFPKTHKRAGEETFFIDKIHASTICRKTCFDNCEMCYKFKFLNKQKLHTIRSNYKLWSIRISEIQSGNAILSIRYWSGKPYNSKQVEICQLDKNSGIGIQKIDSFMWQYAYVKSTDKIELVEINKLSTNDGLSLEDFKEWFKKYDLSKPMAIIHFTSFRY